MRNEPDAPAPPPLRLKMRGYAVARVVDWLLLSSSIAALRDRSGDDEIWRAVEDLKQRSPGSDDQA